MFVFWGHVQISLFNPNPASLIGSEPIKMDKDLLEKMRNEEGVISVSPYIIKPAIIKSTSTLDGIKLKGVTPDYNFTSSNAISFDGAGINFKDTAYAKDIILSSSTLNRIKTKVGDSVLMVFFNPENSGPSVRKLRVAGTYHTGMEEIDKSFAICDARLLQRIAGWESNDISAYQISVTDYQYADKIGQDIYQKYLQPPMNNSSMSDIYPFIFAWLDFQNVNTRIILIIMGIVAAVNMATALLIFILERTTMIGTLKALGMRNNKIQSIFGFHAARVALKGILWGTLLGVGICLLQQYTHIIKLNEETYYMKTAPIELNLWHVLLIDIGTLVFCTLIMLIPSLIVRSVNIVSAIKFK